MSSILSRILLLFSYCTAVLAEIPVNVVDISNVQVRTVPIYTIKTQFLKTRQPNILSTSDAFYLYLGFTPNVSFASVFVEAYLNVSVYDGEHVKFPWTLPTEQLNLGFAVIKRKYTTETRILVKEPNNNVTNIYDNHFTLKDSCLELSNARSEDNGYYSLYVSRIGRQEYMDIRLQVHTHEC